MSEELDRAVFLASFPPIQSAIKRTGNGDGMRVQLDIPETEMGEGIKLFGMTGQRLKVIIEVVDDERRNADKHRKIHI